MLLTQASKFGRVRKPKERPERFILNRQHPLYGSLVFAGLGDMAGGLKYRDSSTNHNDGVLTGYGSNPNSGWSRALGRPSLNLNGTSEYINSKWYPLFGTGNFTLCCWINVFSNPGDIGIMSMGSNNSAGQWIWYSNNYTTMIFRASVGILQSNSAPSANKWVHGAITRNNDYYTMYTNGNVLTSGGTISGAGNNYNSNTYSFKIGVEGLSGGVAWYWPGAFVDPMVFNGISLPISIIKYLADPSNVMLDTGHDKSLILPPKRKLFLSGGKSFVKNNVSINYESNTSTATSPIDANALINYEVRGALFNKEIIVYEDKQLIIPQETINYNISQSLYNKEVENYEVKQSIVPKETINYNNTQQLYTRPAVDYEARGALFNKEMLNYEAKRAIFNKETENYDARGVTTNKEGVDYDSQQKLYRFNTIDYDTKKGGIITQPSLNYLILHGVNNTEVVDYEALGASLISVVRNSLICYEIIHRLINREIIDYDDRGVGTAKNSVNYDGARAIPSKNMLNYMAVQSLINQERMNYDIRGLISNKETINYDVRGILLNKEIVNYDIRRSGIVTQSMINYLTLHGLNNRETISYEALGASLIPVAHNMLIIYEVIKKLINNESINYYTLSKIISAENIDYNTIAQLNGGKSILDYIVSQGVGSKNSQLVYNITQGVSPLEKINYNIGGHVKSSSTLGYDLYRGLIPYKYIISYNILGGLRNLGYECYEIGGQIYVINLNSKVVYPLDVFLRTWMIDPR